MANLKSTTINDTGFLQLPSGTTAQRPASPAAGEIRFNTDTKVCEWYDDQLDAWFPTGVVPPVAAGGDTVQDVDINGVTYRIHSFTTVGESTFTVTRGGSVDFLIVAGGGSGGTGRHCGGGGAGGLLTGTTIVTEKTYTISVGNGGTSTLSTHNNGENSSGLDFVAIGGGRAGSHSDILGKSDEDETGQPGGSGGGAAHTTGLSSGQGVPGQGNAGSRVIENRAVCASGGGAGGPGLKSGFGEETDTTGAGDDGGPGLFVNIDGNGYFWAGGGGGSASPNSGPGDNWTGGAGGIGGGGGGATNSELGQGGPGGGSAINPGGDGVQSVSSSSDICNGGDAGDNTGGGGGGAAGWSSNGNGRGGNGGSGIVIIRYRIS